MLIFTRREGETLVLTYKGIAVAVCIADVKRNV